MDYSEVFYKMADRITDIELVLKEINVSMGKTDWGPMWVQSILTIFAIFVTGYFTRKSTLDGVKKAAEHADKQTKEAGEYARDAAIRGAERAAEIENGVKRYNQVKEAREVFIHTITMLAGNANNAESQNYLPYRSIRFESIADIFKYIGYKSEEEYEQIFRVIDQLGNIVMTMQEYPDMKPDHYIETLNEPHNSEAKEDLKKFFEESSKYFQNAESKCSLVLGKFDKKLQRIAQNYKIETLVKEID